MMLMMMLYCKNFLSTMVWSFRDGIFRRLRDASSKKTSRGDQLLAQGFEVVRAEEEFPHNVFKDIGALLHYLKVVPWQVPDFAVEKYFAPIKKIYQTIGQEGDYRMKGHRFLLVAQKPVP